jgi:mono/diheme cytochrome c family protein
MSEEAEVSPSSAECQSPAGGEAAILAELRAIRALLETAIAKQDHVPVVADAVKLAGSVFKDRCQECHTKDSRQVVKGLAPVLFNSDGEFTVDEKLAAAMYDNVKNGAMPPLPKLPLTDDEFGLVMKWLEVRFPRPKP